MNEEEKNLNEEAEETTVEEATVEETAAEETAEEETTVEEAVEEATEAAVEAIMAEDAVVPGAVTDMETETIPSSEEVVEETVEEAIEEAIETADTDEEAVEAAEETIEAAEAAENETEIVFDAEAAAAEATTDKKQLPIAKIAVGAVAVLVVAAIVVLAVIFMPRMFNKYNRAGYVDVSGRTIAEVAESAGMDLDDFLDSYGLPSDMPANTFESAAYYAIPMSRMAAMYGMDFETLKSTLELPDTITEETTWGEAEGEARLSVYVGEDNLAAFKEQYNLGDEVTGDTQWKEVRNIVDEYNRQQRIDAEKAEKEAEKEEATDAPAEEATAAPAA